MSRAGRDRLAGSVAQVRVDRMAAGGAAIGRLDDGRIVFVDGAIPGELFEARIDVDKRDYAAATAVRIVEPSPDRVVPPCPEVARGCGGCDWQHLSADAQHRWKREVVADALRRTARMPDATVTWGGAVAPWGYRTTMRVAGAADGTAGLRAAQRNDVVALAACAVADPTLDGVRRGVRVPPGDEVSIRVAARGGATALFHGRPGAVPPGVATGADACLTEFVAGAALRVSAGSFFQSGPAAAALLVATVGGLLERRSSGRDRDGVLLDAYGGVGLFAAALGWETSVVVEGSPSACADARHNMGDRAVVVNTAFEDWDPAPWTGRVRVAVADPSRAGLGRGGADVLIRLSPSVLALVSCDPVAMARDVRLLVDGGFTHVEAVAIDLFPQTHHVEVVTLLDGPSAEA
ncbi:MAG: class I SAM-dependent RNA methyltransferase [Ilumatobacteraceae bacterium]